MKKELITQSEFARRKGVPRQSVNQWVKAGKLADCMVGKKIIAEKALAVIDSRIDQIAQKKIEKRWKNNLEPTEQEVKEISAEAGIDFDMSLAEAQRVKTVYDASLKKIEYDTRSGDMMERSAVKKDTQGCAALIKSQLVAIPDRLAAVIAAEIGVSESSEVKKLIKAEINKALDSLNAGLMSYCD